MSLLHAHREPVLRLTIELAADGTICNSTSEQIKPGQRRQREPEQPPEIPYQRTTRGPVTQGMAPTEAPALRGNAAALAAVIQSELAAAPSLWPGWEGMDAQTIASIPQVDEEVQALKKRGVKNAVNLVLRAGVKRCRQVRAFADKKKQRGDPVANEPALIASLVMQGPPRTR